MKRLANLFSRAIIMMLLITSFVACESEDNGGTPDTTVKPKVGTSYTYAEQQQDSVSGQPSQTRDDIIVAKVESSGTTFEGKSDVITLIDSVEDGDTLRYVIESNGDVSFYYPEFSYGGFTFGNPKPWVRFTFGSKQTNVNAFDTVQTIMVGAFPIQVTIKGMMSYVGTNELKKGGNPFASGGQARLTVTSTGTVPIYGTVTVTATRTISYDPAIGGYFHFIDEITVPDVGTVVTGSTSVKTRVLMDYTLIK